MLYETVELKKGNSFREGRMLTGLLNGVPIEPTQHDGDEYVFKWVRLVAMSLVETVGVRNREETRHKNRIECKELIFIVHTV